MRWPLALAIVGVLACQGGGTDGRDSNAQGAAQEVRAVAVQNGESSFTAMRPLRPGDTARGLPPIAIDGPTATANRGHPDTEVGVEVTYYGAPATVLVTAPDGQVVRDTTAPRDDSCDGFDEQHANDPPESDGIGCLEHDRAIDVEHVPPGDLYVQFSAADTGSIRVSIQTSARFGEGSRYWHGLEFRVRQGTTQIFRVTLPNPHGREPLVVTPLTGSIDSIPLPPR